MKSNIYKLKDPKNYMNKRGENFWDYLIWIGIILILGWALLKSLGIINTPIWIEMIPYYGVGATGIGAAYKLGKIMQGVDETKKKVEQVLKMEGEFKEVKSNQKMCMDGKLHRSPYRNTLT